MLSNVNGLLVNITEFLFLYVYLFSKTAEQIMKQFLINK